MWSDILWWLAVAAAIYVTIRVFMDYRPPPGTLRDDQVEGLLHARHLQPDHYYLFVWDMRCISQAMAMKVSRMLHEKGIDSSFIRQRPGTPPVVYDLKRPEDPVKGIENE